MRLQIRVPKQRQVPAKTLNAVPIRGYQSGQPPCPLARSSRRFRLREPPAIDGPFHINDLAAEPPSAEGRRSAPAAS
jgi:hypothetical protein